MPPLAALVPPAEDGDGGEDAVDPVPPGLEDEPAALLPEDDDEDEDDEEGDDGAVERSDVEPGVDGLPLGFDDGEGDGGVGIGGDGGEDFVAQADTSASTSIAAMQRARPVRTEAMFMQPRSMVAT